MYQGASPVAQRQRTHLPVQETILDFNLWIRKKPWKKKMTMHSSILAGKIPWTEELMGYSPWGLKESDMTD